MRRLPHALTLAALALLAQPACAWSTPGPPVTTGTQASADADPRAAYDVLTYRLDLALDPEDKRLEGVVGIEARVVANELGALVLDLGPDLDVDSVRALKGRITPDSSLEGAALEFEHEGERLTCTLAAPARRGEIVRVAVSYGGSPRSRDRFTGFHWQTTEDGRPWIGTSFQMIGAHHWFPCKASFFHPEDKPASLLVNLDVPLGLVGVSNGRLLGREVVSQREIFRWHHPYPLATYSVTANVAPYVTFEQDVYVPGLLEAIPFVAYVLPESEEKARLQFREVPRMLQVFSEAFGPFPFDRSKFALVETSFWGMEHSTAVAYGSSFPAWCKANDRPDPYGARNRFFDYILVHESAHEWWGNAVTAEAWGDFWIQEGFATYAEGVYVEKTQDRATADEFFGTQAHALGKRSRLHGGDDLADAQKGYSPTIYTKGACVLNTLRHYVDDEEAWWTALRSFFETYRYENATTRDFQRVLQRVTREDWTRFFDEWVYGEGYPRVTGTVAADGAVVRIRVDNEGSGETGFRVPLDLQWQEGPRQVRERVWLEPGRNELDLERAEPVEALVVRHLDRVLGKHDVSVR